MNTLFAGPRWTRNNRQYSVWDVIVWWESRRAFYNIVVGLTGLFSCVLCLLCAVISEARVGEAIGLPDGGIFAILLIVLYGIAANLCYTTGWLCELIFRSVSTRERATAIGLKSFRVGIYFSLFLTLLPALVSWLLLACYLITGRRPPPSSE